MQETISKITKDTLIRDILSENPEKSPLLSEIMIDFGIHCVGCGAATFESLEEGVLSHGYSEEDLNRLITNLNKAINEETPKSNIEIKDFKLTLSGKALEKIQDLIKSEGKEKNILRVSVLAGGCSGYTYDLELVEETPKEDLKFKQEDLQISVERDSLEYLNNTEIDFLDSLKESGFKFNNPNANKECGCGKSFS
tara:strand:+ start:818 stop:1405 length:588 start_codon:yes stop_codon:yes gene_type:complete